jgi:hypothetical protein
VSGEKVKRFNTEGTEKKAENNLRRIEAFYRGDAESAERGKRDPSLRSG